MTQFAETTYKSLFGIKGVSTMLVVTFFVLIQDCEKKSTNFHSKNGANKQGTKTSATQRVANQSADHLKK